MYAALTTHTPTKSVYARLGLTNGPVFATVPFGRPR